MATESEGGEFATIMVVLLVGAVIVWFVMRQSSTSDSTQTVFGPANGSQVPKNTAENVETAVASSIPIVGPLTGPLVSYAETKPGASIVPQVTVGTVGTHTDNAGQQQQNQHTGFLYAGISNKPIYAVPGGAEASVFATGGLSLFSSRNRSQVGSDLKNLGKDLEFWNW